MKKAISLTCPECGEVFVATHHRQQYCAPAHKTAYNARQFGRGQAVVALAQVWRVGRNSKDPAVREASAAAFNRLCRQIDAYNREDREAGRADPIAQQRRRRASNLGHE